MKSSQLNKYFILLLILTSSFCFATEKITVNGVVYSNKSKVVSKVNVIVYVLSKVNNRTILTPFQETTTDKEGKFKLHLENKNNYQISYFKEGWKMNSPSTIFSKDAFGSQKISVTCQMNKTNGFYTVKGLINNKDIDSTSSLTIDLYNSRTNTSNLITKVDTEFECFLTTPGEYIVKVINKDDHIVYMDRINVTNINTDIAISIVKPQNKKFSIYPFLVNTSNILPKAYSELDEIIEVMKNKAEVDIKVECHTDSRGDDDFNLKISQEQAKSIKNYLILQGISPERIIVSGFGENFLLNECKNNVKCSNLKHLENRRVEYLFLISAVR